MSHVAVLRHRSRIGCHLRAVPRCCVAGRDGWRPERDLTPPPVVCGKVAPVTGGRFGSTALLSQPALPIGSKPVLPGRLQIRVGGGDNTKMALKILGENPLYLETWGELSRYLDWLFAKGGGPREFYDNAAFRIIQDVAADKAAHEARRIPPGDNVLAIGVDYISGYAGALWFCEGPVERRMSATVGPGVAELVWVSSNSNPPESDPEVVSDPWRPAYFDRVSVLPFSGIRSAVEEYFREDTGFRPTAIHWVKGKYSGELYEEDEA